MKKKALVTGKDIIMSVISCIAFIAVFTAIVGQLLFCYVKKEKIMNYCLNKVEGFNPEEFIEDAKDRNGDVVIKEATKKPLRYLSTDGKILWFRLANPEG